MAGGAVGGIAVICFIILAVYWYKCRGPSDAEKRRREKAEDVSIWWRVSFELLLRDTSRGDHLFRVILLGIVSTGS